jgi:hypothetical protein
MEALMKTPLVALVFLLLGMCVGYGGSRVLENGKLARITLEIGRPVGLWQELVVPAACFEFPRFRDAGTALPADPSARLAATLRMGASGHQYMEYQAFTGDRVARLKVVTPESDGEQILIPLPRDDDSRDEAAVMNAAVRLLLGLATQPERSDLLTFVSSSKP